MKPKKEKTKGQKPMDSERGSMPHARAPRLWIVVADKRIARIFKKNGKGLEHFEDITLTGYKTPDLSNKNVGRVAASARGGLHHKYEPHMNESRKDALSFAHEIAAWLDRNAMADEFDRIVLIAAPKTLGDLRKVLSSHVRNRVIAEISKDMTKLSNEALLKALSKIIWF